MLPPKPEAGGPLWSISAVCCSKVNPAIFQTPFVQTALPIMFTILIAVWINNKAFEVMNRRFDDVNRRFDDVNARLNEIMKRLDRIEQKI
jgi:tetrahydromethanopterin S-methyltransferase subunit G